ncbi:syntaxin-5-like [Mytilus edulis]|uniref:syntaxin-5-like n=1 Tax=Mytilus edulis TaxID=6550 RepID=UPI0039F14DFA
MIARRRRNNSGSELKQENGFVQHSGSTFVTSNPTVPTTKSVVEPEMSCRDRTGEFLSACKVLQTRQINGAIQRPSPLRQRSEFTQIAKRIGRDLANTFTKLEKLTILARRKSLFDDKPVEIQELTYIIKQDIDSLNKQIAQLQKFVQHHKQQNGKHLQTHSNTVVVSLQSKLANMSNDFKGVLEVRTENLKHQKSRREQFSQSNAMHPSSVGSREKSVLFEDEATYNGASGGGDFVMNMDGSSKQHQQQQQLIDQQDTYIEDRANTMQSIESTIVELGSIFSQLAHMVKDQEEMVQRIDTNVEDTEMNIEAAHGEILKYFQSVTSNRWLMIKIFAVLIVFFIVFVVFMA